ncbi:membrane-associated progesterone receptor component 2 [Eurytemora carolleeae]|uniref:membrane-associated progesterone receptor component 2 n=1 Tax=Eurytemora carolleeae TaxID=1294199 RepID=UPI000C7919A0|nr:membrane-associated progesterone receptor component 2 [Eurytemora carolleeae]|eukprot:XP_023332818.1 membrane-associated progesterone receptor component 2-like [Eurytemora affinis]
MSLDEDPMLTSTEESLVRMMWDEVFSSWLNIALVAAIFFLIYKILSPTKEPRPAEPERDLPPLKKQDMDLKQLREYDGSDNGGKGRVCVAVNGKIFDVTRGRRFYGPGGPYSGFAGRDASRGLATFSVEPVSDDYDDLSDLKPSELEQVKEWELQFNEKYDYVGRLLKPGEIKGSYSDDESDISEVDHDKKD